MLFELPEQITDYDQAEKYLSDLHKHGYSYHTEDDTNDIEFLNVAEEHRPTAEQCAKMNELMGQIYDLPGNELNDGEMKLDPNGFFLDNDKEFYFQDHSGRDGHFKTNAWDLKKFYDDDEYMAEWIDSAEDGDEYNENPSFRLIRIN